MLGLPKKERSLGVAKGKRRYDLPFNKSAGTGFLVLLISLMTFLALLALAASFTLADMTGSWTAGLENKVTIEIPAETKSGALLKPVAIDALTRQVSGFLEHHPDVLSQHALSADEIRTLVAPWLGGDLLLDEMPLPGLISVTMRSDDPKTLAILQDRIQSIAPQARLDTHEEWLNDFLRFTGAMQFAAIVLALVIGLTTMTAVAGAVHSRMAVHHDEVELLHLMGASDPYISRQFQWHSMILGLQGGLLGAIPGALALLGLNWISGEMGLGALPHLRLETSQIAVLTCLPILAATIVTLTARQTVLSVLSRMP